MIEIMNRVEQKYIISNDVYNKLIHKLNNYLIKDDYFKYTICNIYFDTDSYELIKNSLEKPIYKEKIRLRSYGIPTLSDNVFLEVKKKYDGVVNKRRIVLKLNEFYDYLNGNYYKDNSQIMNELDYAFNFYKLKPKVFLAYDRYAYKGIEDNNFRVTFDYNIRSRSEDLRLEEGDAGYLLNKDKTYIMEVKALGSIPLWFSKLLSELKIYPASFSKYGEVYKKYIKLGDVYNV